MNFQLVFFNNFISLFQLSIIIKYRTFAKLVLGMRYLLNNTIVFLLMMTLFSCHQTHSIEQVFSCQDNAIKAPKELVSDFKKTFSIELPKHWNTKLYYDNAQSEIFSADTVKIIENSIIFNTSMIESTLNLDEHFKQHLEAITSQEGLTTIKTGIADFETYNGYYHLGKGVDKNMPIQVFQWYINCKNNRYFRLKIDIYGEENTDKRLCEALSLVRTLKFNNL